MIGGFCRGAFTFFVRGRAAIASLGALDEAERPRRLDEARHAAKALNKQALVWTAPLAAIVSAFVANGAGNPVRAEQSLRRAIDLAKAADMAIHAAAAQLQLGGLIGGDDGGVMAAEAADTMRSRGVRAPERYAGMLVPGPWSATRPP